MSFVTVSFLIFVVSFLCLFYIIKKKWRWLVILLASYVFYASEEPFFIVLLIISTLVDFLCGLQLNKTNKKHYKKIYLAISIVINLGLLIGYKYIDFIKQIIFNGSSIFDYQGFHNDADFIIPIGISFYTFQTLSYTIDLYRNKISVERHLGHFAVFVSFFPQLIAGPIERSSKILPQIKNFTNINFKNIILFEATGLIIWGLFKKILIADRIGMLVDKIYDSPSDFSSFTLLFSGILFMIQIYCDFSGYTLIARGTAKLFGIELSLNWNYPLFQSSFKQFWINWHMTLSKWFKDYIYIPLGGSRNNMARWSISILLVFFISGLWHGANITFIVWGLLNAIFLILERIISIPKTFKILNFLKWLFVFTSCGLFFISFRANSLADLQLIIYKILTFDFYIIKDYITFDMWIASHIINIILISIFFIIELVHFIKKLKLENYFITNPNIQVIFLLLVLLLGEFQNKPFIYFQF